MNDDYCFMGALNDDSQLRNEWLKHLASSEKDVRSIPLDDIMMITYQMSDTERRKFIGSIDPAAVNARGMIIALVGTSEERYKKFLGMKNLEPFWSAPLQRVPDKTWNFVAREALKRGISCKAIVGETRKLLSQFGLVPKKYHDEIDLWKASLDLVYPDVLPVVELGLNQAQRELDHWERWERERDI